MGFICTAKTVANYKELRSFLDSAPPKLVKNQIWLHDKFSKFLFLLTSVIYINKGQTNSSKHIPLKCIHSYIQSIIQCFSLTPVWSGQFCYLPYLQEFWIFFFALLLSILPSFTSWLCMIFKRGSLMLF